MLVVHKNYRRHKIGEDLLAILKNLSSKVIWNLSCSHYKILSFASLWMSGVKWSKRKEKPFSFCGSYQLPF